MRGKKGVTGGKRVEREVKKNLISAYVISPEARLETSFCGRDLTPDPSVIATEVALDSRRRSGHQRGRRDEKSWVRSLGEATDPVHVVRHGGFGIVENYRFGELTD